MKGDPKVIELLNEALKLELTATAPASRAG